MAGNSQLPATCSYHELSASISSEQSKKTVASSSKGCFLVTSWHSVGLRCWALSGVYGGSVTALKSMVPQWSALETQECKRLLQLSDPGYLRPLALWYLPETKS